MFGKKTLKTAESIMNAISKLSDEEKDKLEQMLTEDEPAASEESSDEGASGDGMAEGAPEETSAPEESAEAAEPPIEPPIEPAAETADEAPAEPAEDASEVEQDAAADAQSFEAAIAPLREEIAAIKQRIELIEAAPKEVSQDEQKKLDDLARRLAG